jgi:hypothetical protein
MKLAAYFAPGEAGCREVVEAMAHAQQLFRQQNIELFAAGGGAFAAITTGDQWSPIAMRRSAQNGNLLLVSGVPLPNGASLDATFNDVLRNDFRFASQELSKLDGAHASLFWDAQSRKLVIVTDILGMQPLYLAQQNGKLILATELKGVCACGSVDAEMDLAGWGAFLSFGHNLGDRTMMAGVRKAPAGSILIYDADTGSLEENPYWNWPAPKREIALQSVDTGSLIEPLRRDVERYLEHSADSILLLSGGFDSRLLLGLLHDAGHRPKALILNNDQELFAIDAMCATRLARQFGLEFQRISSPRSFYGSQAYLNYLVRNEVATQSLFLFIATLAPHTEPGSRAVWEGAFLGPGLKPRSSFSTFFRKRLKSFDSPVWKGAVLLFGEERGTEMRTSFQTLLDSERSRYSDDGFGAAEFVTRNRIRNRTAPNPLAVFANNVLPFTPGLSRDFWDRVGGLAPGLGSKSGLYLEIYRRHFPDLLNVPVVSGGAVVRRRSVDPEYSLARMLGKTMGLYRRATNSRVGVFMHRRGLGPRASFWDPSPLIDRVIERVQPDHPELDGPAVRMLQGQGPFDRDQNAAREILFYWQIWRWIMEGQFTASLQQELLDPPRSEPLTGAAR